MKKGQKIKLLTNVGKLKKNEIVTVTGVDYALRMAFIKNDKGISESVDNNFSNYQSMNDSKERLKTYKIKNHDSGKTYSVKAVNYTDAKAKYNKHILKDNRHRFEALWYADPDFNKVMTQTFATEKEAMDFYRKNKGKPTFYGWWVTERHPGSWAVKKELVMDTITEDSWASYTFKTGLRSDAFKQYLRDRGIYFEASQDREYTHFEVKNADEAVDRRANEIVRQLKDAVTEDAYVYPTNASTMMAYSFAKRCVEKFGGKVAAKNGYKYVYVAPDKNTAEKAKTFLETNYSSILPSVKFIVGDSRSLKTYKIKNNDSGKTYRVKATSYQDAKDKYNKYILKDSFTEDALTEVQSNKLYKLLSKLDKYDLYEIVYGGPSRGSISQPKRELLDDAFHTLVDKSLTDVNRVLRDYNLKLDSLTEDALSKFVQSYLGTKKVSSKAEQDEIIKFLLERNKITTEDIPKVRSLLKIIKDSITEDATLTVGYSFTNPSDAMLYTVVKFKKVSNNSYIALLKSKQGKYFLVNDLNHNDYGTKFTSSRHFGHDVDYALEMFAHASVRDSFAEDADIAQTDIKSTYLPEDANADNIQYLGFNEKRKLSFYGYGDRYFVHYDLEGRTEEVDKETVQKILKKNILGEIDENDLINKEPQSEEIVSDAFENDAGEISIEQFNPKRLVESSKSRKQALHNEIKMKNGDVYTVFFHASGEIENPRSIWVSIVLEKSNGQQERVLSEKANSYEHAIQIMTDWKKKQERGER